MNETTTPQTNATDSTEAAITPILQVHRLGTIEYLEALELQERTHDAREKERLPNQLLLLEHPPVITLGRKADKKDVLASDSELRSAGATVVRTTRGGETTYHGPGQIVGYPIIHLYQHARSIRSFVRNLEEVFIRLLAEDFGIPARRDENYPGVWVENDKITAIGISVSRKVTMHGFAMNVNTNLAHFGWIIPCGILDRGVTSLERLTGGKLEMAEIETRITRWFAEIYRFRVQDMGRSRPVPAQDQVQDIPNRPASE